MKKATYLILSLFTITFLITSCGGGSQPAADQQNAAVQQTGIPADIQAMMPRGEEIYKTKCIACHQPNGQGLENMFPPLANSDYLMADKVRAVAQTLNGSKIEMTVNGKKYTQEMLPQVDTKEDAVAVINYVLNNFGNKGGFVTLAEVANVEIKPRPAAPAK
ncbi:MAG TPA: cytochrome c [Bacteroidales bacterium]|nr:cytochrome c [Bacteroidales bacterium]HPS61735.1 cytochrome c [Bacteroidales bacterium]